MSSEDFTIAKPAKWNAGAFTSFGHTLAFFLGIIVIWVAFSILGHAQTMGPSIGILGLVMILAGGYGMLVGPHSGLGGKCPYCGFETIFIERKYPGFGCPACGKRILLKGNEFHKVDPA